LAGLSSPEGGLDRDATWRYVEGINGYRKLTETAPPTLAEIVEQNTPVALRLAVQHGFTQHEIALELGVSQSTVHRKLRE
jgi:predicted DNA-binding protein (UPF0251 family)